MAEVTIQLAIIFLSSVLCILLAIRFRLPPIVGLLLAGVVIGPNMLGFVQQSDYGYINVFAEIGAILLLFSVGIELSIGKIADVWLRSVLIWVAKDALVFVFVYEVSLLFGLADISPMAPLALASALAISSTTFFIKLADEKGLRKTSELNTMLTVLILEDVLAVFLLAVYSGLGAGRAADTTAILVSILRAIASITVAYVVLQRVTDAVFQRLAGVRSDEVMVFLSLSFAIMLSFFASFIGLAPSIGAFLAGSILSSTRGFKKIEGTISKFNMLFSAFFFLSIGMLVNVGSMLDNILIIAVFFVIVVLGVFCSVFASSFLLGYRSEQAVRSGLLVLAVGEFSLIIAKQTAALVRPFDIISVTAALVFLTALAGGIAVQYEKLILKRGSPLVPFWMKESASRVSLYLNSVIKELEVQGAVYKTFTKESRSAVLNLVFLVLVLISAMLAGSIVRAVLPAYEEYIYAGAALLAAFPLFSLVNGLRKLINSLAAAFHKAMGRNIALDDVLIRDSVIAALLFAFAVITPVLISLMKLPGIFGMLFLVPLALSGLFIWNLGSIVRTVMTRKTASHYERAKAKFAQRYGSLLGMVSSVNRTAPVYKGRLR